MQSIQRDVRGCIEEDKMGSKEALGFAKTQTKEVEK